MFDFIADVVDQFLVDYRIEGGRLGTPALKMGFTFSFPVDQTALDVGTLMHWNKGFDTKGVVGKDVVGLLRAAFERKVCRAVCDDESFVVVASCPCDVSLLSFMTVPQHSHYRRCQ